MMQSYIAPRPTFSSVWGSRSSWQYLPPVTDRSGRIDFRPGPTNSISNGYVLLLKNAPLAGRAVVQELDPERSVERLNRNQSVAQLRRLETRSLWYYAASIHLVDWCISFGRMLGHASGITPCYAVRRVAPRKGN